MLWAIDVGNSRTVIGLYDNQNWVKIWRLKTDSHITEDEWAVKLRTLCELDQISFFAKDVVIASVVPSMDSMLKRFFEKWLFVQPQFVTHGKEYGLRTTCGSNGGLGADRLVNCLAGLQMNKLPLIILDFGTATTIDVLNSSGLYAGGAILPGLVTSMEALAGKTAKLPHIDLTMPDDQWGLNTVSQIQLGILLGHAGSVDRLISKFSAQLGEEVHVVATGGLGALVKDLSEKINEYDPMLTLKGLMVACESRTSENECCANSIG